MPAQARLKTALSQRLGLDVPTFGFQPQRRGERSDEQRRGLRVYGATRDTPEEIRSRLAEPALRGLLAMSDRSISWIHLQTSGRATHPCENALRPTALYSVMSLSAVPRREP